ncbi:hypothetical protein FJN13_14740 [Alteromonas mediterranea]|uniref:DUF6768 family protein n=1 Tax=Alteromonas mediterranea TaxID=314275 RepID=UPI0011306ED3|nr:DUF6768 family protein [Alteromonas mediterranea]QDG35991.1 hypothetical protein FJN13_14740 [Alteromonas mediterranea]
MTKRNYRGKEGRGLEENNLQGQPIKGIFSYLRMGFAFDYPTIMKLGYAMAIIFSVLLFFCGYQFFTADKNSELFWGVCFVVSVNAQVTVKLWIYMQTNHNIVMNELRLLNQVGDTKNSTHATD